MLTEFTASTTLFDEVGTVENWKPVVGYPDYEVSDMGRVRCIKDRKGGKAAPFFPAVALNPAGRPMVTLRNGSVQKARRVDEIVLEAFSGPRPHPDYGPVATNNDPADVREGNLTWVKGVARKTGYTKKVRRKAKPAPAKISSEIRHGHWLGTGNVLISILPNNVIELTVADAPDHHSIPVGDLDDVIRILQAARTIIDGG